MTEVCIPAGALVMIGNGKRALFMRNKGTALCVQLKTEQVIEEDNPPTHEQGSDRPGRFLGADRVSRSAVEQTDWHQLAEDRFAVRIAHLLYRWGMHICSTTWLSSRPQGRWASSALRFIPK